MLRIGTKRTKFGSVRERAVVADGRDEAPAILDRPTIRRTEALCVFKAELEQVRIVLLRTPVELDVTRRVLKYQNDVGDSIT